MCFIVCMHDHSYFGMVLGDCQRINNPFHSFLLNHVKRTATGATHSDCRGGKLHIWFETLSKSLRF